VSHYADADTGNAYPHPNTWNPYANSDRYRDSDGDAWRMSDGDHPVEQPDDNERKLGLV
jgi:hypothetical protein